MTTPRLAARLMNPMLPGLTAQVGRKVWHKREFKQHGSHRYRSEWKWASAFWWRWLDCVWCGLPMAERRHSIMIPCCSSCAVYTPAVRI